MVEAATLLLFLNKWMVQPLSSKADSRSAGHFPVFSETPNDVTARSRLYQTVPSQQTPHNPIVTSQVARYIA